MKPLAFRWRIALGSAFVTALALAMFSAIVAYALYRQDIGELDSRLSTDAGIAFAYRKETHSANDSWIETLAKADPDLGGYVLLGPKGELRLASPPAYATLAKYTKSSGRAFNHTIDGVKVRVGEFTEGDTTLLLAAEPKDADQDARELLEGYALALPFVLLLAGGGGWWLAGRALQPMVQITRKAESITADRLAERLPETGADDEIARHVRVLNGMLDRLERGFLQAGRFAADASHELRTPLTILRGEVEQALHAEDLPPAQEAFLVNLQEQVVALQKITENLLLLARFDAGKIPLDNAIVDLSELATEVAEDAELLAAPQQLQVEVWAPSGVRVSGDPVLLRRVLLNLVDNAVRYNRPGGRIKVSLEGSVREAHFRVGNTGNGIPAGQRDDLFKRFFRLTADRGRATGGSGLGLSLCREIVTAHKGRIELARAEADWTEFAVHLPRAQVE
jgi:signal transduction histidine kinase